MRPRTILRCSRPLAAALALFLAPGCRNTPPEPRASASAVPVPVPMPDSSSAPSPPLYRPSLDSLTPRLLESLPASPAARISDVRRIDVPGLPNDVNLVAFRDDSSHWHVAAVEPSQVTLGLAGAERVHARLIARGENPSAVTLARIVGALHYFPSPVFDGQTWITSPLGFTPTTPGSTPLFASRPAGLGRSLVFSYAIAEGTPGAGIHLANIRITDSGYLIDAAPNPERR